MKKIVFVGLAFLIALALVSCGNNAGDGAESEQVISENDKSDTDAKDTDKVKDTDTADEADKEIGTERSDDPAETEKTPSAEAYPWEDTSKAKSEEEFLKMKQLVIYPEFPEAVNRIYDYDVMVSMEDRKEKIPVYNHVVESNVSRQSGSDIYRRFSMFAFSGGTVRVDIKVKTDFTSYTVFPSAKNFKHDFRDGVISVYLDEPDYFGVQLDDNQNSIISIFADYPEYAPSMPKKGDPDVIYVDSWYEPVGGKLTVDKEGTTVYIAPGAVLNARVTFTASNCKLIGHGAIIDPFENIYEYDIRNGGTESSGNHLIDVSKTAENCLFDGPIFLDARTYNFICSGANNTVRNIKEMSAMMTSDGISLGNGTTAEHMWIYVGDNGIVSGSNTGFTVRDISIGTTCAALFPQNKSDHQTFEDINVFRADDGIVNNRCNNGVVAERTFTDITFRRLCAIDMPENLTHLFQGRHMGTLTKIFTFEDVTIPEMKEVIRYDNSSSYMFTDNYTLNIKNLSVGGEPVKKASDITIYNPQNAKNTENITCDPSFKGVKRNVKIVNYTAKDKIYIGARQVFLKTDAKRDGGKLMLPTEEICTLLRVKKISDAEFVSADELKAAKAVAGATEKGGTLYLVPVYNGENLLLADEGEISRFAENACYRLDLVVSREKNDFVYTVYASKKQPGVDAGISRQITDEVRMYGSGKYRVMFSAKGSSDGTLRMNFIDGSHTKENQYSVGTSWKEYKFDIDVTDAMMESPRCVLCFVGFGTVLDEFSLKNITLTKIN